jgi:hypothetical protein
MLRKFQVSLLASIAVFTSCNFLGSQEGKETGFYDYYEDGDIIRIPLDEPYEITSPDGGLTWFFDVPFGEINEGLQISDIRSVHVEDSLFFFYSHSVNLPGETTAVWLVFDINNKTSRYYTNHDIFLRDFPGGKDTELVSKVFDEFKSSGKLPWRE